MYAFHLGAEDEGGGEAVVGHCGCGDKERRSRMVLFERKEVERRRFLWWFEVILER